MKYVVDTNVAVAANGRDTHASEECQLACIDALLDIRESSVAFIDDLGLILEEYHRRLNPSGQPGTGDQFYLHVLTNQGNSGKCQTVSITSQNGSFEEFPNDPALASFDNDDHKFIAVACASGQNPLILNALDCDWHDYEADLRKNGVRVKQLCPEHMANC